MGAGRALRVLGVAALAEGRGSHLIPGLPECWLVLCKPAFSAPRRSCFTRWIPSGSCCHPDTDGVLRALERGDLSDVARRMYNVFEDCCPRLGPTKPLHQSLLLGYGALGACMSGTGPTVWAV